MPSIEKPQGVFPSNWTVGTGKLKSTIYQNTTGKPLLVMIDFSANVGCTVDLEVDSATPPTATKLISGLAGSATGRFVVTFMVPTNYYYRLNETAITLTVNRWNEVPAS